MKNMALHQFLLIGLLCFGAACSGARDSAAQQPPGTSTGPDLQLGGTVPGDSLFFRLERTPCFGPCKAYRISVYRSGYGTFDGILNMEKEGPHAHRIEKSVLEDLLTKAQALGFFDLKDRYDADVTDLPSTVVRIAANGQDKTVLGRVGAPSSFKALVEHAESILLPMPWKPLPAAP